MVSEIVLVTCKEVDQVNGHNLVVDAGGLAR
jgi:hypothetical protein